MRGDNLKRHMKTHEKMNVIEEAGSSRRGEMKNVDDVGTGTSSVKCTNIDLEMLEKNCESYEEEFNRKIELGRNLKIIINKRGFNIQAWPHDMKEALKTYRLYGKNMDMEEIDWRGWQKDLRQYLDKACNREIICLLYTSPSPRD